MSDIFADDQGNQNQSALDTLVGEGKKFSDHEALAKGKQESDTFIEQLKDEKRQLSEELEKVTKEKGTSYTVADLIKTVQDATSTKDSEGEATKPMSEEDLQERIRSVVEGDSAKATAAANRALGNKLVLDKMDGNVEAATAYVAERAKELGLTPNQLAELSENSPDAFAKVMDAKSSTASAGTANLPGTNTQNILPGTVMEIDGHKTKAWYDSEKKRLGLAKYINNTSLMKGYLKDSIALEERFNT